MEIAYFRSPVKAKEIFFALEYVVEISGAEYCDLNDFEIYGVCDSRKGGIGVMAFSAEIDLDRAEEVLKKSVIFTESKVVSNKGGNVYVTVSDARGMFVRALQYLINNVGLKHYTSIMDSGFGISPSAIISSSACIEDGVIIGDGVVVSSGCVIKRGTQIGKNTIIRENSVIGCEGITVYRCKDGELVRFPHACGVIIGKNTEIGAGCTIPRGILSSTIIGDDVVIGNLCNVGHGAVVGDGTWMSVGSLIGGHSNIGEKSTIGMGVKIRDNITVGDNSSIGMGSVVVKNVSPGTSVFGNPAKRMPSLSTGPKR